MFRTLSLNDLETELPELRLEAFDGLPVGHQLVLHAGLSHAIARSVDAVKYVHRHGICGVAERVLPHAGESCRPRGGQSKRREARERLVREQTAIAFVVAAVGLIGACFAAGDGAGAGDESGDRSSGSNPSAPESSSVAESDDPAGGSSGGADEEGCGAEGDDALELTLRISPTIAVAYGPVYNGEVVDSCGRPFRAESITLTVLASDSDIKKSFESHLAPEEVTVTFERGEGSAEHSLAPITGFVDREDRIWKIVDVRTSSGTR